MGCGLTHIISMVPYMIRHTAALVEMAHTCCCNKRQECHKSWESAVHPHLAKSVRLSSLQQTALTFIRLDPRLISLSSKVGLRT